MRRSYLANQNQGHGQGYQYQNTSQMLEEDNQQMEDELKGKVNALKSLSIDIGVEVREQNKMFTDMDNDFDASGNLLTKTMGRLKAISRAGHWKLWLYIGLFAFFVFFMCWIIVRFK